MKNKFFIISFILNLLTFLLVLTGTILMLALGTKALGDNSLSVFKYFTFQSNLFMGFVSIIYAYYQFLVIKEKRDKIPHVLTVFNHVGVTAVTLTFLIVIAFLGPLYSYALMYTNANLFFHLLVPLVAMINFVVFINYEKCHFLHTLYTIVPCSLYGIVYFIVVAATNGYGDLKIDFYGFGKDGPLMGAVNFLIVISIAYAIGVGLYFLNKIVCKKHK